MPARSQTKATRLPSGDHTGLDGCLMSIRLSMVMPPVCGGATALAEQAPRATVSESATAFFMENPPVRSNGVYSAFARGELRRDRLSEVGVRYSPFALRSS